MMTCNLKVTEWLNKNVVQGTDVISRDVLLNSFQSFVGTNVDASAFFPVLGRELKIKFPACRVSKGRNKSSGKRIFYSGLSLAPENLSNAIEAAEIEAEICQLKQQKLLLVAP